MRRELVTLPIIAVLAAVFLGGAAGSSGVVRLSNAGSTRSEDQGPRVDKIITPAGISTIDYFAGETTYERSYARVKLGAHTVIVQWKKSHAPTVYKLGPRLGTTELVTYIGSSQGSQRSVEDVLKLAATLKATVIDSPDRDGSKLVIFAKSGINAASPEIFFIGAKAQYTEKLQILDSSAVTYKAVI